MIEVLIDDLITYLDKEKDGFAEIPEDFFDRLRKTINELEKKYKAGDLDPIEEDKLRTLKRLRRQLFEKRFGKLVRLAMLQALGFDDVQLPHHILPVEAKFFQDLVKLMEEFRKEILE